MYAKKYRDSGSNYDNGPIPPDHVCGLDHHHVDRVSGRFFLGGARAGKRLLRDSDGLVPSGIHGQLADLDFLDSEQ